MKFAAALLMLVGVAMVTARPMDDQDFDFYKLNFDKKYNSDREYKYRKDIFLANRDVILAHNRRYEAGLVSHMMGVNRFTDFVSVTNDRRTNGV